MRLSVRWQGDRPKIGDYLMSTMRPRYAYRVLGIVSENDDAQVFRAIVERTLPRDVPDDAVVHAWRWDRRERRTRR